MVCDFQSQVIKVIAVSALLSLGSPAPGEASRYVVRTPTQPCGEVCVVRNSCQWACERAIMEADL